jgi:hypothetical protein
MMTGDMQAQRKAISELASPRRSIPTPSYDRVPVRADFVRQTVSAEVAAGPVRRVPSAGACKSSLVYERDGFGSNFFLPLMTIQVVSDLKPDTNDNSKYEPRR